MSALVTALLLALAGAVLSGATVHVLGRWGKRQLRGRLPKLAAPKADSALQPLPALSGFRLKVGEVISVRQNEVWLETGWLLSEGGEGVALVLFSREATLVALPAPRAKLFWLKEIALDWPDEPPSSLDVAGLRFERARRVPVEIEALGDAPDPPWQTALLTEYRALDGEVLWALGHRAAFKAWKGRRVEESDFEHWG